MTNEQGDALRSLFPVAAALSGPPAVAAVEPPGGWGRSQDRDRNKLIEQAGINQATRHYESLGYQLSADRQTHGVGYDLEFTRGGEVLKVEAKGIAGTSLAFNLTDKEWRTSQRDSSFRLCAVTDALGTPRVRVLTGAQLAALRVQPVQYRVQE